ncbi:MAG: 2-isopropylmalate synthase [Candidatus Aquilonibacter sp.]
METIEIFDTTLRDGEQSPGAAMTASTRLKIARLLDEAGVDTIEAGFPISNEVSFQSVRAIAKRTRNARVAALARCMQEDIEAAAKAVAGARRPRIHVFIATSPVHLRHKLGISAERAVEMASDAVRRARTHCDDVEFSAEDATRSDPAFLAQIFSAAVAAGATTLNVPDTVGYITPAEMEALIGYLRTHIAGVERARISVHTHDDLGMATANALAAVRAGARQVECTINGIGERAGNCALEEIVVALQTRADLFGATARFDTANLQHISKTVARGTRMPVQKNKAVVGANAFAHESGIHQDGVLKDRSTYEIVDPRSVGRATTLTLGRNSGRHALFARAGELGLHFDEEGRRRFARAFDRLAARQASVGDADLIELSLLVDIPTARRRDNDALLQAVGEFA